ncbi:MAG: 2-amino-4-hydroxy-6-hydroxymethyldihydropteridine diphosphokinase [Gammaproteobacteria bacterium]|nr:2-amino-4-hydroxy-6-hydroxymethyldihydropteridine diphosphokinase [Gammaproteobacteria bacterium]
MTRLTHWYPAYVGIGSNLNGPASQVENALGLLDEIAGTRVTATSSLYRSGAFGGIEQPDFVNAVAALLTTLQATELLRELQAIENRQGRERDDTRWGPRVIDLDLLVYSSEKIDATELTVPHPGIGERNFVLLPLVEIAPDLVVPGLGRVASIPVNMDEPSISRIA